MKAVVFYESAPDLAAHAPAHGPAHRARWAEFSGRGELLMIGPFANAQDDGALAVFTTREAAEEFVRGDPFVVHGVVSKWTILDWNEALVPERLPGAGGRSVAVQDLGAVLVPRCGGAVAVQGEGPAPLVDDNEVVEGAEKDAVLDAGLPAAGFVPDVAG